MALIVRRLFVVLAIAVLPACSSSSSAVAPQGPVATPEPPATLTSTITAGISANAGVYHFAIGADGRIWFSEFSTDKVGALTTAGTVTEYTMPALSQPNGITLGPDGNIWTGGYGGVILKVTPAGAFTAYPIAGAHIGPLTVGPDNNIWYTDYGNNKVGFITTGGAITPVTLPAGSSPSGITKGPDGNLWVADGSGAILKVTTSGAVTKYSAGLTATGSPNEIVTGPDGNMYFTEPFFSGTKNDKIGVITTAGVINEIGTLAPNTLPQALANGADGNVYFTEYSGGKLGRITVSTQTVSEFALGFVYGSSAVIAGPDGHLWVGANDHIYTIAY